MPSAIFGLFDLSLVWGTIKPDNHLPRMPLHKPCRCCVFPEPDTPERGHEIATRDGGFDLLVHDHFRADAGYVGELSFLCLLDRFGEAFQELLELLLHRRVTGRHILV
jgi:hypothetical protein